VFNQIKLIIFDLDDTLIRSRINYPALRAQILDFFSDYQSSLEEIPILGLVKRLQRMNSEYYIPAKTLVEETEHNAALNARIIEGADSIPDILSRYNIHGAIYTNNSSQTVNLYLNNPRFSFLNEFFILTRNDITNPKPDPEGIFNIISRFNNMQKENTIYIGDSYIDAGAAYEAGIRWILYNSRNLNLENFISEPSAIINHWSELESLLFNLSGIREES
jgi:phosphoglycolate phosphatase